MGVAKKVEQAANWVEEKVVTPVVKGIENVGTFIVNNPTAALLDAAAIMTGNAALVPYINAGNAISKGADPADVAKNFALSYAAGQVLPSTGSDLGNVAASSALSAAVQGRNPLEAATTAGLTYGLNTGLDTAATALNQPTYNQDNLNVSVPPELLPAEDPNALPPLDTASWDVQPTDYSLTGDKTNVPTSEEGLNPAGAYTNLSMSSVQGQAPGLATMGGGSGLSVPMDEGTLSSAGYIDQTAMPALGDPGSFINNPNVTGQAVIPTPSCAYAVDVPNIRLGTSQDQSSRQRQMALGYAFGADCMGIPWLDTRAQMLRPIDIKDVPSATGYAGGLGGASTQAITPTSAITHNLPGIEPELMDVIKERGYNTPLAEGGTVQNFADGSSAMSYCSASKFMDQFTPKFYTVKCNMLQAGARSKNPLALAQLQQLRPSIAGGYSGMAKGGLPTKYQEAAPDGHHPEFITGLTGYYAGGRGTGQSDDIPAMLHDGDYVIDAEAVSALGDGSSKAGNEVLMNFMHQIPHPKTDGGKPVPAKIADGEVVLPASFVTALGGGDNKHGAKMLDEMRKRLREHKRSAPDTKIPPKAKSPLEYLRGVKG